MRKFTQLTGALAALALLGVAACERADFGPAVVDANRAQPTTPAAPGTTADAVATGFPETFETGSKGSYAAADITLPSGSWRLSDAVIGTLSGDAKNGARSVRVTASGTVGMNFDAANGAGTFTVKHGLYGTDAASSWQLWKSVNGGTSWTQVGTTVTTSSASLQTATFTVNQTTT